MIREDLYDGLPQECGVCDGLGVGRDKVVLIVCHINKSRAKRSQDVFDKGE